MITDAGKEAIGDYLALGEDRWARYISLGIGTDTLASTRTELVFEIARAEIFGYRYDAVAGTVYVRAQFNDVYDGPIDEIGLWTDGGDSTSEVYLFDEDEEAWTGAFTAGGGVTEPTYMDINGVATTNTSVSLTDDEAESGDFVLSVDDANSAGTSIEVVLAAADGDSLTLDFTLNGNDVLVASQTLSGSVVGKPLTGTATTTGGVVRVRGLNTRSISADSATLVAIEQPVGLVADRTKSLTVELGVNV